ncbi:hypothetical protein Pyrfu_1002 [Pyrolobus fumarii 1A]|uniref:Uncharacterized protein n=1 Tax=Pyrolobus fumarii (strain DSM 11204 / 1A) TaxID=694429 RepID=G0EEP8_PYRF1|nr:hypothetical protein [Pyrolobus fumarii]AEM38870.1 hypothetical protein Pyrfu_1002 [Pyrolobus fumarii 1A]
MSSCISTEMKYGIEIREDVEYWERIAQSLLVKCGGKVCIRGSSVSFSDVKRFVLYALMRGVEDISQLARLVEESFGVSREDAVRLVLLVLADYEP